MSLPVTEGYNLTTRRTILINVAVFLFITAFFQVINLITVGLVLGGIISIGLYIYQGLSTPGAIEHFLYYNKLPGVLSGNKREE